MKKKNAILISVIGLATILVALIGATFAYFTAQVNGNNSQTVDLQASGIDELYYSADSTIALSNVVPGEQDVKTFTVQNKSTKNTLQYNLYLVINKNTFNSDDGANQLVFNFASSSSVGSKKLPVVLKYDATGTLVDENTSNEDRRVLLAQQVFIAPQEVHSYTVTLKFNDINKSQNSNIDSMFEGYFTIDNSKSVSGNLINDIKLSALPGSSLSYSTVEGNTLESVTDDNFNKEEQTFTMDATHQSYYMTYADAYTLDAPTASFAATYTLTEPQVAKYSDIYESLAGKFIVNYEGHNSETAAKSDKINRIYKVVSATADSITYIPSSYTAHFTNTNTGLYRTDDNYGATYFYRGNVTNNYVKFGKWTEEVYRGYNAAQSAYKDFFTKEECLAHATYNYGCNKSPVAGKDMYWRIVRINGDNTLRLMYDGTEAYANGTKSLDRFAIQYQKYNETNNNNAYVGYMYGDTAGTTYDAVHANTNSSAMKIAVDKWYEKNFAGTEYENKISDTMFCNDRSLATGTGIGTTVTQYGAYRRLVTKKEPSLVCPQKRDAFTVDDVENGNGDLTYPIGLLTADEVSLAGGKQGAANRGYYINKGYPMRLGSPARFSGSAAPAFLVPTTGRLNHSTVALAYGAAPVINLNAVDSLQLKGSGTMNDPYTL